MFSNSTLTEKNPFKKGGMRAETARIPVLYSLLRGGERYSYFAPEARRGGRRVSFATLDVLNKLVSGETPDKAIKLLAHTLKSILIIFPFRREASTGC